MAGPRKRRPEPEPDPRPSNVEVDYPLEAVSFVPRIPQRIVEVGRFRVRMPVTMLTADLPQADLEEEERKANCMLVYTDDRWNRGDVFIDLARLWVDPLGRLTAPTTAITNDALNPDRTPLILRPLAARKPGDEFLVPALPTHIEPGGLGRRFHLARLPLSEPKPTTPPQPEDARPAQASSPSLTPAVSPESSEPRS